MGVIHLIRVRENGIWKCCTSASVNKLIMNNWAAKIETDVYKNDKRVAAVYQKNGRYHSFNRCELEKREEFSHAL